MLCQSLMPHEMLQMIVFYIHLSEHKMTLPYSRTIYLNYRNGKTNGLTPTSNMYTFCGQTLTSVDLHCYLGIHLSNTLNWTAQTKAASTKAQQKLGVVRRNLNKCPTHIKTVAYTSLVRPILEYASAAWAPHSQNNIKTLERIQRQAARFCKNNYSREPGSVTKLLQELGWETLQTRRKSKRITTLYKMEHNIIDIPLDQYIYQTQYSLLTQT